ncbi:acyltransferase [Vibrio sinensis]|uniref:Acyltransferase n=1 Tax=Vibrio sinensis TaxID=2302434 RepID=A0A3A6Q8Z2_9VIBR|nr:acyltransferase [Vibrio sinensis]RJX66490.1 acyltransferase [Vibrio sinensis]
MIENYINQLKIHLKNSRNPRSQQLFRILKRIRACDLPTPHWYNRFFYLLTRATTQLWSNLLRVLIFTPAFKGRLNHYGKGLYLFGGLPFISGPLSITVGNDCRISGQTTFSGRAQCEYPQLIIGNNVDIGWQNTLAVGRKIVIGNNVRLAGSVFMFGYSGHSIDANQRAIGAGDDEQDVGDIILERNVWVGTNVTICPNVTVGEGTIIGAASVVTKSLPPFVIAAGNPAKIIRHLEPSTNHNDVTNNKGGDYA